MTIGTHNNLPFDLEPRTHTAIFGKTGTGKSVLLENCIVQHIRQGHGVTVLDPHGGLIERVLTLIPRRRTNDVIYLNPAEDRVPGINMFEVNGHTSQIVSSLTRIIKNIWSDNWGPRSEWLLENLSFALLTTDHPISLLSLYKLLIENDFGRSKGNYRKTIAAELDDPAAVKFFHTYEGWTKSFREEVITPLLNKVSKLALNPHLRAVIGQPRSSFRFRDLMDSGKILLCDLSKGRLGDDVSSLLGSIVVTKLALAALSRDSDEPRPHYLYADEIQNFIHGVDFPTILAEARKYGLFLTVATQTLSQVPERTRSALFGNCATLVAFRSSGEDAVLLQREFAETHRPDTFLSLPNYSCYARTMRGRFPTATYVVDTFPPEEGSERRGERIKRASLTRWGRPKDKVEARIRRHLLS